MAALSARLVRRLFHADVRIQQRAQLGDDVPCQQAALAARCSAVTRTGMQAHTGQRRPGRLQPLGQQSAKDPAQDIAHAGSCHAGIPGGAHRHGPGIAADKAAGAFQNDAARHSGPGWRAPQQAGLLHSGAVCCSSRPALTGWGVSIQLSRLIPSAASRLRASASTTSGCGASSTQASSNCCPTGSCPSPGPITTTPARASSGSPGSARIGNRVH